MKLMYEDQYTYIILVSFFNDVIKKSSWHVMLFASLLKLIHCNVTTAIFVKIWKGCHQMFLALQFIEVQCSSNEFYIINGPTVVYICLKDSNKTKKCKQLSSSTLLHCLWLILNIKPKWWLPLRFVKKYPS